MVQEFHVVRCCTCRTCQVHIVRKDGKFGCKMCGLKQSVQREYGRGSAKDCRLHVQKLNTFIAEQELRSEEAAELDSTHVLGAEAGAPADYCNRRQGGLLVEGATEMSKNEAEIANEKGWEHFSPGFNYCTAEYSSGSENDVAYGNEIGTSSCAAHELSSSITNMVCCEDIVTASPSCSMPFVFGAPPFAKRPRYFDYNGVSNIHENDLEFNKTKHTPMKKSNENVVGINCESVGLNEYERNMTKRTRTEITVGGGTKSEADDLKIHRELLGKADTSSAAPFVPVRDSLLKPENNTASPSHLRHIGSARITKLFAKYADSGDWDDSNE